MYNVTNYFPARAGERGGFDDPGRQAAAEDGLGDVRAGEDEAAAEGPAGEGAGHAGGRHRHQGQD